MTTPNTRSEILDRLAELDPTLTIAMGARGKIADAVLQWLDDAKRRVEARLPEGMEHCTIRAITCPKGHARLTATNWVPSGCLRCELDNAEPRLRPVSEKPRVGDLIAQIPSPGCVGVVCLWGGFSFIAECRGWILLERAKPKTLAEEARELLATAGGAPQSNTWAARAEVFIRRIAEENRDARF